jgi:hypothetical protein
MIGQFGHIATTEGNYLIGKVRAIGSPNDVLCGNAHVVCPLI